MNKIIRQKELVQIIGLSPSTIWRKEKSGNFPKRIQLGVRSVGWLAQDIDKWIESLEKAGEQHNEL